MKISTNFNIHLSGLPGHLQPIRAVIGWGQKEMWYLQARQVGAKPDTEIVRQIRQCSSVQTLSRQGVGKLFGQNEVQNLAGVLVGFRMRNYLNKTYEYKPRLLKIIWQILCISPSRSNIRNYTWFVVIHKTDGLTLCQCLAGHITVGSSVGSTWPTGHSLPRSDLDAVWMCMTVKLEVLLHSQHAVHNLTETETLQEIVTQHREASTQNAQQQ